jgi:hypothetical protein
MSIATTTARTRRGRKLGVIAACVWLWSIGTMARAETIEFYAHGSGLGPGGFLYFPHAFVLLRDDNGQPRGTYGFTAISQSPGVLVRRSKGAVHPTDDTYVQKSQLFLTLSLSAEQVGKVLALTDYWNSPDGSLYDLQNRNCVTFVADLARTVGLVVPERYDPLKPTAFMQLLVALNGQGASGPMIGTGSTP